MPDRPLLLFPNPERVPKPPGYGGGSKAPPPTNSEGQAQRIEQQFADVQAAFVSDAPGDIERVLVMETAGRIDDLQNAIRHVPGLEWLAEIDADDIDLHDLYDEKTGKKVKGGRFYILSSNKSATDRLLGLWKKHREDEGLEYGYGKFNDLFKCLLTLRRWGVSDRLGDTGILETWQEEYHAKKGTNSYMNFEIELHYRHGEFKRNQYFQEVCSEVKLVGGRVGSSVCIDDIAFHALKVELPVSEIEKIMIAGGNLENLSAIFRSEAILEGLPTIFKNEAIRYCRPTGQHIDYPEEISENPISMPLKNIGEKPPVIALLDGAPLLKHRLLDDRISLFDPDDYSAAYEPAQQKHGTAMASLICHGDLNRLSHIKSLTRRIYARPVMKPDENNGKEKIPSDSFQEDIIERAVKEMFDGDNPVAPDIRVINLSLGNIDQRYFHSMSPWARLLDWLAFKYKVLFIVSAGNYLGRIEQQVLSGINENQYQHRLLAPAESMNALTVGALQGDSSGDWPASTRGFDPIDNMNLPAPYSRIGPGYRGSVKPEIFTQGGRLLYDQSPAGDDLEAVINNEQPGVQTASPGAMPENLDNTIYAAGTSHAAAIVSHGAGRIFEMLEELREDDKRLLTDEFDAVLIKTLLVHSASQGTNGDAYQHLLNTISSGRKKRYLSRYLGYGNVNIENALECTQTRATAVGCGLIGEREQERHCFIFPLPPIDSIEDYVRLTITLGWFSPGNPYHIGWRRARLFFEGNNLAGVNGHERQEYDWQQVRKGTIQHEIFELNKRNLSQNFLEIFVQCAADAGGVDDEIPYGIAVTLEVAEKEDIDLYQEIKTRIQQKVRV